MRKVFSSHSEVAEVWARQNHESGRAGNIFFEGGTIYSYGHHFPIACIEGNVCLFTTRSYSNSTGKHKTNVKRSIPNFYKVLYVENPVDNAPEVISRNAEILFEEIVELRGKALRARKHGDWYLSRVEELEQNLSDYCALRFIEVPKHVKEVISLFD